jgi:DNA-binding transcriptional LysR family regulator
MTFGGIRGIRLFVLCAKHRSITRAARELRTSQPAASRQLKRLQHDLRTSLLKRNGRGIELTKAGQTFLNKVSPIMSQLHALEKRYTR